MDTTIQQHISIYPTHSYGGYRLRPGKPLPFGATMIPGGVNFSVYSCHATACTLVLFEKGETRPVVEIPFPDEFRIGNVYAMVVFDLEYEHIEYGYRIDGPFLPREGHRFDRSKILLDPYAKSIGGRTVWGTPPDWHDIFWHRSRLMDDDFDWRGDRPLEIPAEDLVIYEMHVRGFTRHPSAGVNAPGTFTALREKIPYLKALGVNCIELLPVFEFDEFENYRRHPDNPDELLMNYWGYSTVGFFAPKAGYATTGQLGGEVDEFKETIRQLHEHGIEVFLDVVFNHTAEGNERGPTISFRGLDNKTYYMLTPEGHYYNFSGTGNTLNCNHPIVRNMVLECLRYWAAEYHIDGFRFDLASILGRDSSGGALTNPPLLETLAADPVLAKCKLIAEAWDAGGLYQVGSFPAYGRWAEWNGKYRDDMRRFLKGDIGMVGTVAQRLQGSPDLYEWRGPGASINFFTCHDGFTLADLVSYNEKHNDANGEDNRDGSNENYSWNCGVEGPTDDPEICRLRKRQMKNALAMLLISQGVPMLLMGDEVGRTQQGNNNAYCQDNEISWMDWDLTRTNTDMLQFVRHAIAFRHAHPILRSRHHFTNPHYKDHADLTWHGVQAWNSDWSYTSRILAFMLCDRPETPEHHQDDYIYVAMNMYWEPLSFELPELPRALQWHCFINTAATPPDDSCEPGSEPLLSNQQQMLLEERSMIILVGR